MPHNQKLELRYLLEWHDRDKCLLLAVATLPLFVMCLLWVWFTGQYTAFGAEYLSDSGARQLVLWLLGCSLVWLLIIVAMVVARVRDKPVGALVSLTIFYYGLSLIPMAYYAGLMMPMTGVVMLGAAQVGFILFDYRRVLFAFLTCLTTMILLAWATLNGSLPYAPLLVKDPILLSSIEGYWLLGQFFIGIPFVVVAFTITYMLLSRWSYREAQAQELAITDQLTGLPNRRAILDVIERELARSKRSLSPVSVVMVDLDNFKTVNDTWGHETGDKVLRAAAKALRESVRESDWVGRFGGEEFILILANADQNSATQTVERSRSEVQSLTVLGENGEKIPVTASFGICSTMGDDAIGSEEMIRNADKALYHAKFTGRNRYEIWHKEV